jgi:hypothetical protein
MAFTWRRARRQLALSWLICGFIIAGGAAMTVSRTIVLDGFSGWSSPHLARGHRLPSHWPVLVAMLVVPSAHRPGDRHLYGRSSRSSSPYGEPSTPESAPSAPGGCPDIPAGLRPAKAVLRPRARTSRAQPSSPRGRA